MSFRCASISFTFFAVRFARRWPTNRIQFKSPYTRSSPKSFMTCSFLMWSRGIGSPATRAATHSSARRAALGSSQNFCAGVRAPGAGSAATTKSIATRATASSGGASIFSSRRDFQDILRGSSPFTATRITDLGSMANASNSVPTSFSILLGIVASCFVMFINAPTTSNRLFGK